MLGVDLEEEPAVVAAFGREFDLPFPLLLDRDGTVQRRFGVRGHPSSALIDRRGRIVGRILGERNWGSEAARRLIRSLLDTGGTP
jgi:peroxiredoxin